VGVGRFVWVASEDGTVTRIDPNTHEASEPIYPDIGRDLDSVAPDDDDSIWVTGEAEGKVVRIEEVSQRADRPINPKGVRDLKGLAASNGTVWIADCRGSVVRIGADSEISDTPDERQPRSVAVRQRLVYVAVRPVGEDEGCGKRPPGSTAPDVGRIAVLDEDGKERRTLTEIEDPAAVAVTDDWIWVADQDGDRIWRVDPDDGTRKYATVEKPDNVAAGLEGVWALSRAPQGKARKVGVVTQIDPETLKPLGEPIRIGGNPWEIAVGDGQVWVSQRDANTVRAIPAEG
jgi:streptogramin lyase